MAVPGKKAQKTFSSSTTSAGSDEDLIVYCQPCDFDGQRLPAYGYCTECKEHLCESCFKHHKKQKLSRHHTLLKKDDMPKTLQLPSTSVAASLPDDFIRPCTKHNKEVIKFYCNDHKSPLCSVCVTLEHIGTSCKVKYIPDISGQLIDSEEYKETLKTMDIITNQCQKISEDVKKMTEKSNNSLADVLEDIRKFRNEINQKLDDLERQAKDSSRALQHENDKKLKAVNITCDEVTKSIKTISDSVKHLNTSKQADKLFLVLKHAEKRVKDYERRIQQLSVQDLKGYKFQPNEALSNLLAGENSLGTLKEKDLQQMDPAPAVDVKSGQPPPPVCVKSRQVSRQEGFCIRTSDDDFNCYIKGMTLLTADLVIICDFSNESIKMIDTVSQSATDQLKQQAGPWNVTLVTSTELAVTLPSNLYQSPQIN